MNRSRVLDASVRPGGSPAAVLMFLVILLWGSVAKGDGLAVRNVLVAPRDATTATVSFDVAWEHSWRRGSFHDAAWVFFKTRADGKSPWRPVRLAADKVVNPTGYGQAPGGSRLEFVVPDGEDGFHGVFLRRAEEGIGPVAANRVTVVLDVATIPGVAKAPIQAFGLEMVHVPEGPFDLGVATGKELNRFYAYGDGGTATPPYTVSGPGPIPTGRQPGRLWATGITPEDGGEIPGSFPNGYRAFYAMRFAITQGQYADFLNSLPEAEAALRYFPEGHGKWIGRSGEPPNRVYAPLGRFPNTWFRPAAPDRDHRCPWLSSADSAAFAAWAGLRPMTELEYEKTCRGPALPVLSDQSGSFWGVEDINLGQMYERPISAGSAAGRSFKGSHGRGTTELPPDWPKDSSAAILRGDVLHTREYTGGGHQRISGRLNSVDSHADRKPHPLAVWRGARTAPAGDATMRPVIGRFNPTEAWKLPGRTAPVVIDGKLDEWGEPTFVLNEVRDVFPMTHTPVSRRFPTPRLPDCWGGPADLGARIHVAREGADLCVAVEVTDDRHFNDRSGAAITDGDSVQIGISTRDGHRSFGLARTAAGVVFHQWQPSDESLLKAVDCAVARDDAKAVTRYELRLPLAVLRLDPGAEFGFNVVVYDNDDGKGAPEWIQMAPGTARGSAGGSGAKYLKFLVPQ